MGVWVGSIVFFSFVVAPTVFRVLSREDAARLQRALFPLYYLVGIVCAAVGIVCVGTLLADRAFGKWPGILSLLLLAGMGGADFWLRQTVVPQMARLRAQKDEGSASEAEWKALHRVSVQLNAAVLLAGLALIFLLVYARVV